ALIPIAGLAVRRRKQGILLTLRSEYLASFAAVVLAATICSVAKARGYGVLATINAHPGTGARVTRVLIDAVCIAVVASSRLTDLTAATESALALKYCLKVRLNETALLCASMAL